MAVVCLAIASTSPPAAIIPSRSLVSMSRARHAACEARASARAPSALPRLRAGFLRAGLRAGVGACGGAGSGCVETGFVEFALARRAGTAQPFFAAWRLNQLSERSNVAAAARHVISPASTLPRTSARSASGGNGFVGNGRPTGFLAGSGIAASGMEAADMDDSDLDASDLDASDMEASDMEAVEAPGIGGS